MDNDSFSWRSAVDFVWPAADVEVPVEVQVFGAGLLHQAVLGALVVFVAVVLVRVIIFWDVFGHLSGERHAIRCLLCQCHGDDNSEENWKNINWRCDLETAFKLHTNREFPYQKSTSSCELYTSDLPLRLSRSRADTFAFYQKMVRERDEASFASWRFFPLDWFCCHRRSCCGDKQRISELRCSRQSWNI